MEKAIFSHRPISLLNSLSKILEKIINGRLIWFLESKNYLHPSHYRELNSRLIWWNWSTYNAFAHNAKVRVYSVFFNMENEFPRVLKHLICEILQRTGPRGPSTHLSTCRQPVLLHLTTKMVSRRILFQRHPFIVGNQLGGRLYYLPIYEDLIERNT